MLPLVRGGMLSRAMPARLAVPVLVVALLLGGAGACEDPPYPDSGALRVGVTTGGGDPDLDGYTVSVEGVQRGVVPASGSLVIPDLATGVHSVGLGGLASNCAVTGDNPRNVTVFGDTSRADFAVACLPSGVHVTTTTTGLDLDTDGYAIAIDGVPRGDVGANGSLDVSRLTPGAHTVTLSGAASNCAAGDNPRSVTVVTGELAAVAFSVACTAVTGVVEVRATTSGIDLDANGYAVQVDSGTEHSLSINGVTRFPGLDAGQHTVTLVGAATNCTIAGVNPRTVSVTTGGATRDTARTTFELTCTAFQGVIIATVATSGVDLDQNGYTVRFDAANSVAVGINGTATMGVTGGDHEVALEGVAPNCAVGGENPRTLTVTTGGPTRDTVRTTFTVVCTSLNGIARIITATSGVDVDANGYFVFVDCYGYYGGCYYYYYSAQMAANDTVAFSAPTGDHTFQVEDIAPNCTLSGDNPRSVYVAGGDTTDVVFSLTCAALARIDVTTTTTGIDLDATGYNVVVTGPTSAGLAIGVNETKQTPGLLDGNYTVKLTGLSLNCTATSPSEVPVTAPGGATVAVAFTVDCTAAALLAFTDNSIHVIKVNGAGRAQLTAPGGYDAEPAWSPDGSKIAFVSARDGNGEIYVMDAATGANQTRLTAVVANDAWPAWSPDGSKIAFTSQRDGNDEIYVMNADGSSPTNLTANGAVDGYPAWSPDGTKIAFYSSRGGIYVMNANGSGVTQITHDASDGRPAWSPDGTKLTFSRITSCGGYYSYYCQRDVFVVNSDGSGSVTAVASSPADEGDPAWSTDGAWIAFSSGSCDYYNGCYDYSIQAVRSNGTDQRMVVAPSAFHPAWKP